MKKAWRAARARVRGTVQFGKTARLGTRVRGRAILGAGTVAATVGLSVFGAAGSAGAAANPVWNVAYKGHSPGLYSVTDISKTNAWAVGTTGSGTGSRPQFMNWNGRAWSLYSSKSLSGVRGIAQFDPMSVRSTAWNNVWTFGDDSTGLSTYAVVYNGSWWQRRALPAGWNPGNEAVLGPKDVWGATVQQCTISGQSRCTVLAHWNGSTWSTVNVAGEVVSVDELAGHVFFVALVNVTENSNGLDSGTPVIYEPGSAMQRFAGPNVRFVYNSGPSLVVEYNGQRYLAGSLSSGGPMRLYHEVGSTWSSVSVPSSVCSSGGSGFCPLNAGTPLVYDHGTGVWAGYGAHYTGSKWVNTGGFGSSFWNNSTWGANFAAIATIYGSSSVWAVGSGSFNNGPDTTLIAVNGPLP